MPIKLETLIEALPSRRAMTQDELSGAAHALVDPGVPAETKEAFLEALSRRGETPQEIAGFARTFRSMARDPGLGAWSARAIDVCGTGGDRSGSFNISTVVAFVLAAAGVPVIKHGNRSITSKCGSADLLEALGIRIDAGPDVVLRSVEHLNFVFLFAPAYHPAFKEIGPVRRALAARGVRTVFNLLGPLLNPAAPAHQVVGVFGEGFVEPVARALDALGLAAGLAVHSADADGGRYDELTTVGENAAAGFGRLRDIRGAIDCTGFGLQRGKPSELAGGDTAANVALLYDVFGGRAPGALIDTIVLNAAAALHVVGRFPSIEAGLEPARELLQGGTVRAWLERARAFYDA